MPRNYEGFAKIGMPLQGKGDTRNFQTTAIITLYEKILVPIEHLFTTVHTFASLKRMRKITKIGTLRSC